jgi:hypothetical protein
MTHPRDDRFTSGRSEEPSPSGGKFSHENPASNLHRERPDYDARDNDIDPHDLRGGTNSAMHNIRQTSQDNKVNGARWILIVVGLIQIGFSIFAIIQSRKIVQNEARKFANQGILVDEDFATRVIQLLNGGFLLAGVMFVILGILVKWQPILCTLAGLILYLVANIVAVLLNGPETMLQGLYIKIIVIFSLISALKAAFDYHREKQLYTQ